MNSKQVINLYFPDVHAEKGSDTLYRLFEGSGLIPFLWKHVQSGINGTIERQINGIGPCKYEEDLWDNYVKSKLFRSEYFKLQAAQTSVFVSKCIDATSMSKTTSKPSEQATFHHNGLDFANEYNAQFAEAKTHMDTPEVEDNSIKVESRDW